MPFGTRVPYGVYRMNDEAFQQTVASLRNTPFREDFLSALCDLYTSASQSQRAQIRSGFQADGLCGTTAWRNPTDYERSDLIREQRMRQRLVLLSIQDGGDDYRDDFIAIAHCYHNLAVRGVDADVVLRETAAMSAPKFASVVLNFVNRPPKGKSAEAFGLYIIQTPDGPIADYAPSKVLIDLIRQSKITSPPHTNAASSPRTRSRLPRSRRR